MKAGEATMAGECLPRARAAKRASHVASGVWRCQESPAESLRSCCSACQVLPAWQLPTERARRERRDRSFFLPPLLPRRGGYERGGYDRGADPYRGGGDPRSSYDYRGSYDRYGGSSGYGGGGGYGG